jgi:hypothetical protein
VIMISVAISQKKQRRAAIVFLPSTDVTRSRFLISDKIQVSSPDAGIECEASVNGDGLVWGIYTESDRTIISGEHFVGSAHRSKNVYFQVALDLKDLSDCGIVSFASNEQVIPAHDGKTSLHLNSLPRLPRDLKWGPEIGGVMTIQKRIDPYVLYFCDVLADHLDEIEEDGWKRQILEFIEAQAVLLSNVSKTYEIIGRVYKPESHP